MEIIDKDLKNFSKGQWFGILFSGFSFWIVASLGLVWNYLSHVEFWIILVIGMTYMQMTKNFYRIRNLEKKIKRKR